MNTCNQPCMTLSLCWQAANHHVYASRICGLQVTDVATEDVHAHGAQGLQGCCTVPMVAVTHLFSSISRLKLLCQTTGQWEEQILLSTCTASHITSVRGEEVEAPPPLIPWVAAVAAVVALLSGDRKPVADIGTTSKNCFNCCCTSISTIILYPLKHIMNQSWALHYSARIK